MALIRWKKDLTLLAEDAETGKFTVDVKAGAEQEVVLRSWGDKVGMTLAPKGTIDGPEVSVSPDEFETLRFDEGEMRPQQ